MLVGDAASLSPNTFSQSSSYFPIIKTQAAESKFHGQVVAARNLQS